MGNGGEDLPGRGAAGGRPEPTLPAELREALAAAPVASERFAALAPAHRREYVRWVTEARRTDSRERRAAQTVMRLLERS
ncbi:MAG: multi-domain protein [Thermoleophilia bacterium]|nr:multi-domain protein [Thermoleophilia bacterium]